MKKNFEFRDGSVFPIQDVLDGKVPEAFKYAPITYYRVIGESRPWRGPGKIGVTRALNGTRQAFLDYSVDYNIKIDGSIFMVLGIQFHGNMEIGEGTEMDLEFDGIRGRSDLVNVENGENVLTDYKFLGSYGIVKTLGVKQKGRKPVVDKDGNPVLYKRNSGNNKVGDPKTEPVYVMNFKEGESYDYAMQGNMYRICLERNGTPIDKIKFWLVPRDGGTQVAIKRGITKRFYYVEFPRFKDDTVLEFFRKKRDELSWRMVESQEIRDKYDAGELDDQKFVNEAGKLELMPPVCSDHENWTGRKCKDYCDVAHVCKLVGDNNYLIPRPAAQKKPKEDDFGDF